MFDPLLHLVGNFARTTMEIWSLMEIDQRASLQFHVNVLLRMVSKPWTPLPRPFLTLSSSYVLSSWL